MVKRTIKNKNCFSINTLDDMNNIQNEFKNKKVLITGATGGIGQSLVKKFLEYGAIVLGTGTNTAKLSKLQNDFKIDVEKFTLDDHKNIENFVDKVHKKLNGLDILVNNAGITLDNLSIRLTEENWKK